ncbi:hypothetical protein [Bradyrhizobium sp. UFLA05-112]
MLTLVVSDAFAHNRTIAVQRRRGDANVVAKGGTLVSGLPDAHLTRRSMPEAPAFLLAEANE